MAEHDGIGRRGDRQHEGVAAADGGGHHQVDRVHAQVARHLGEKADFKKCKRRVRIINYFLTQRRNYYLDFTQKIYLILSL